MSHMIPEGNLRALFGDYTACACERFPSMVNVASNILSVKHVDAQMAYAAAISREADLITLGAIRSLGDDEATARETVARDLGELRPSQVKHYATKEEWLSNGELVTVPS